MSMSAPHVLRAFCARCKRERVHGRWIESEMPSLDVEPVTHGLCPECSVALLGDDRERPILDALRERQHAVGVG
jgi:hypothetical protein